MPRTWEILDCREHLGQGRHVTMVLSETIVIFVKVVGIESRFPQMAPLFRSKTNG